MSDNMFFIKGKNGKVTLESIANDVPHQQLVTDSEGKAVWEEKPFYESPSTVGELLPETTIEPTRFTIGAALCFYADCQIDGIVAGNEYIVTVDSVDYTVIATSDERTLYLSYCEKNVPFEPAALFIEELGFAYGTTPYGTGFFGDGGLDAHTYKVQGMVAGATKPLDEQFIPSTVPVIPTATVGQTIVVKAVDEDGKPTEWEAVDVAKHLDIINNSGEWSANMSYDEAVNASGLSTLIGGRVVIYDQDIVEVTHGIITSFIPKSSYIQLFYCSVGFDDNGDPVLQCNPLFWESDGTFATSRAS